MFITFNMDTPRIIPEPPVSIMKLTDFKEDIPIAPAIPLEPPPVNYQNTIESIAVVMVETDEIPDNVIVSAEPLRGAVYGYEQEDYLPMHKVSIPPLFSEQEIRRGLVYPAIALKSGIEGTVYLELFVDQRGEIQKITIMKEDPVEKGFGEAAVKAFQGVRCTPAQANGVPVAVRYRYPVRFSIR